MQIARSLDQRVPTRGGCHLAIGFFDGVHIGHRRLLGEVVERARASGMSAGAITFEDHPQCLFTPGACPQWLMTPEEKNAALRDLGLDFVYLIPFDWNVARRTAEEFATWLHAELGARELLCGPDFALGKDRRGTVPVLRALGAQLGFAVRVIEPCQHEASVISSTLIRDLLAAGAVKAAGSLLGRPYSLVGAPVAGRGLGRQIGVPTLNLEVAPRKVLPAQGVYAARVDYGEGLQPAVVNLGLRPTVGGNSLALETHVIGESLAVAPRRVALYFVDRLRDEHKFAGLEELVRQIHRDIEQARPLLSA